MERVLVVDDDAALCGLLRDYLAAEGFEADGVHDGNSGLERAVSGEYAILVLDVMLPGLGGFDVLRQVRATSTIPIVMLSARGEEADRVVGLELGADDYIAKPFSPRELAARIRAVLRRVYPASNGGDAEALVVGDLEVDTAVRVARRGGMLLNLTWVEFELLETFVREVGQVIARDDLVRRVLGRELRTNDRGIDNHVSNLRRKLGPRPDGVERIRSVRGAGYTFTRPSDGEGNGQ